MSAASPSSCSSRSSSPSALNLLTGTAGLLALDAVVFYGLGAYTAAILSVNHGTAVPRGRGGRDGVTGAALDSWSGVALVRLTSIFFAVATMGLTVSFHTRC